MNNPADLSDRSGLVKLSGVISGYHRRREVGTFFLSPSTQTNLGVATITAAVLSLSDSSTPSAGDMEEEADHISFWIDGKSIQGWVWRSPFKTGDEVEVVAEWQSDHYEAFGIARTSDRIVALYPHCSRGRAAHFMNALFWYAMIMLFQVGMTGALLLYIAGMEAFYDPIFYWCSSGLGAYFGLMVISLSRKWSPFVQIAEKVFRTLQWSNPSWVDLVKSSKAQRTAKDKVELGTFYFRY